MPKARAYDISEQLTWDELPPELDPLTTKPLLELVNGPKGIDLQLEAELADLSHEEAAEFRGGGESALGEVVRRLVETLDLCRRHVFPADPGDTRDAYLPDWTPDPAIARIVTSWPAAVSADRAARFGLAADPDFDTVLAQHIAETTG